MSKIVRLKPYAPKKGLRLRTFTFRGNVFRVDAGWYEVDDATARYLATVRNDAENEESPKAFDILGTKAEAAELEETERKKALARAEAADPIRVHRADRASARGAHDRSALTTHDLPGNQREDEGDEADLDAPDLSRRVRPGKRPAAVVIDPADDDAGEELEPVTREPVGEDAPEEVEEGGEAEEAAPEPVAPPPSVPGAPRGRSRGRKAGA